jgi:non-canonical (house-cleaning) NTP pyrophosphatase
MSKLLTTMVLVLAPCMASAYNEYTTEYGESQIIPAAIVFPNFQQGNPIINYPVSNKINVIIASTSDIKVNATKKFFNNNHEFKNTKINYEPLKSASNIAEQPIGLDNGILGATNRINNAKMLESEVGERNKTPSYYVAVENFFSEMPATGKPTDHALLIIETPDGKRNVYLSDGVEVCRDIYEIVITPLNFTLDHTGTKSTIGEYLAFNYRIDPADWFGYVTDQPYNREQQIATAFRFARRE